jgi:hypothetical protein
VNGARDSASIGSRAMPSSRPSRPWRAWRARTALFVRATTIALATAFATALSAATAGCGEVRAMTAAPSDYADYRSVRFASDDEHRLDASLVYLARHPRGAFADELRGTAIPKERAMYEAGRRSLRAARTYVRVLPHGPHVDELRAFVTEAEAERDAYDARLAAFEAARERSDRIARGSVGEAIERWSRAISVSAPFGAPLLSLAAPGETSGPLGAAMFGESPSALCDERRCEKALWFRFAEPALDSSLDAELAVSIRVEAPRGTIERVELTLADWGYSTWLEAVEGRRRSPETRKEAIAFAENRVESIVRRSVEACTVENTPAARELRCPKFRLRIEHGDDDRLIWTAAP